MKRYLLVFILIMSIISLGCTDTSQDLTPVKENKSPEAKCGDGICDSIEKERGLCPEDCIDVDSKKESKEQKNSSFVYDPMAYTYSEVTIESPLSESVSYIKYDEKNKNVDGHPVLITDYYVINPSSKAK
ncbi:MAG: hypothetical protein GYA51_10420, partial [Candidatus Methanofastidiosa archaeon]|nr:hypothetical protein [Candidatus Methanofastidiosa archaeon]